MSPPTYPHRPFQALLIKEDMQRLSKRHNFKRPKKNKLHHRFGGQAKTFMRIYMETASIHGLNHLVAARRQYCEIFLWLTIIILSITGALYLSSLTWTRYQSSPTVVSMDKDMFAWNTTFPSITVCPYGNIDKSKLDIYLRNSKVENKSRLEHFIRELSNATYKTFENVPEYDEISPNQYKDLLLNLSVDFKPKLTYVGSNPEAINIVPTFTEMGLCYAVHSRTGVYNSPAYLAADRWDKIDNDDDSLAFHPLDGEVYAKLTMDTMPNILNVYIHGPQEIPDITSKFQPVGVNEYIKMYVTALAIYTTADAASLSVSQRHCRYPDENNLKHNSIYTYTMCRMECRIRLCLKYCQCIPHFYRRIGDEKVCDVDGLHCLAKYKDELYTLRGPDDKKIHCGCVPLCKEINYVLQPVFTKKDWMFGTNIHWGMSTYPRMRYRRDVIFGFTDLLVAVGSMAGLFLGCNVLSFMEIIYFLTFRLIFYILGYR